MEICKQDMSHDTFRQHLYLNKNLLSVLEQIKPLCTHLMFISCTCRVDVDSSDESDMDDELDQPTVVKSKHHDLMMKAEGSRKGSFFKQAKKSYPMFPTHEERIKWDEYGEIIRYLNTDPCEHQITDVQRSYTRLYLLPSLMSHSWSSTG